MNTPLCLRTENEVRNSGSFQPPPPLSMPYPPELTSAPERLWCKGVAAAPQVTVVLPTHNRPRLLKEAMTSLVAQTHRDWEVIVVGDGSTPKAALETADPRFQMVRHSVSLGGAAAKNTGLRHARGEIVAFLDDDDLYAPEYLARAVEALRLRPDLDVVFMGATWFGTHAASGQHNYDRGMQAFMDGAGAPSVRWCVVRGAGSEGNT